MIYDYVVTLRNKNARLVDTFSILLCALSLLVLISTQISNGATTLVVVICLLTALVFAWNLFMSFGKARPVQYSKALLLAGVGWLTISSLAWIAIPVIAMAFIEKPAKANLEIGFTADEIVMNTLFKRRFTWAEFSNIMLKDDLLTMDFKSNKVFQRQTIDDDTDATEDEFNEYCAKQLSQRV